jgi:hypothetical protein
VGEELSWWLFPRQRATHAHAAGDKRIFGHDPACRFVHIGPERLGSTAHRSTPEVALDTADTADTVDSFAAAAALDSIDTIDTIDEGRASATGQHARPV